MSDLTPCMGGFCLKRQDCAHYHANPWRQQPAERLCGRGKDDPEPMRPAVAHWWRNDSRPLTTGEPL